MLKRSAMGMRVLARRPPSSVCISARKSIVSSRVDFVERAEHSQRAQWRQPWDWCRPACWREFRGSPPLRSLRVQEGDDSLRLRRLAIDQLQAQEHEKRVIGAAGGSFGAFGIAAVGAAERFEQRRDFVLPRRWRARQRIDAGRDFQQRRA